MFISVSEGATGLFLRVVLVLVQTQFGFIPVELQWMDVLSIMGIILFIGSIAAMLPSRVVLSRLKL